MSRRIALVFVSLGLAVGCNATLSTTGGTGGAGASSSGGAGGTGASSGTGGDINLGGFGGSGGGNTIECNSGPNDDADGDGFTPAEGDCNDCDKNANPGAIDVIITEPDDSGMVPPPADEDCDGIVDNALTTCDDALDIGDPDPKNGARAIELCRFVGANDPGWGVLEAKYVRANGTTPMGPTYSIGLLSQFGTAASNFPQAGARMLGLSSGFARDENDASACGAQTCEHSTISPFSTPDASDHPNPGNASFAAGYPQSTGNCTPSEEVNDDVGLRLKIRTPTNATGFTYRFRFFSFEYPEWVCDSFNDQFIAWLSPAPPQSLNGNISFDSQNNPVSVNVAFFDAPVGDMAGTGYNNWNDAGVTVWLQSSAPVVGGDDIDLFFLIYDVGDSAYDSLALVDKFEWVADGSTVTVETTPPN